METNIVHSRDGAIGVGDTDCFFSAGKFFGFIVGGSSASVVSLMKGMTLQNSLAALGGRPRAAVPSDLFWLKCLRDHHLTFEALHHVGI